MANTARSKQYRRSKNSKSLYKRLYATQRSLAKIRRKDWDLTLDEWYRLTKGDCYLCGAKPGNVYTCHNKNRTMHGLTFVYQGIDRISNEIGYMVSNCVSCCIKCNSIKSKSSLAEMSKHIQKIVDHSNILEDLKSFVNSLKKRPKNEDEAA